MTTSQHVSFWLALVLAVLILLLLLSDVLLPFVLGAAVAYLADPVVDRMEARGIGRVMGTSLVTAVFFTAVVLAAILIIPVIASQVVGLIERFPIYVDKLYGLMGPTLDRVIGKLPKDLDLSGVEMGQAAIKKYAENASLWLFKLASGIWSGGLQFLNIISLLVITPVVAFYLLWEWDEVVARIDSWLPRRHAETIRRIFRDIDAVVSGFVRGQISICVILALFYGVGLSLVGLDFGFVIGVASGALSFIPFVGAIFGAVASIGVALVQFWPDYIMIGAVAVIYAIGQFLEGNILTPKLVGSKVGLHPVWVIFGLLAGGTLFGFVGMLLAVPAAAVIGVLTRFGLDQYLQSRFYSADGGELQPSFDDADEDGGGDERGE